MSRSSQSITGMPNAVGVQTPIYLPAEDPLFSVLYRDLQVDKDNASVDVEDITSTIANNSATGWNVGVNNAKSQFTINSGTDYRLNLSKLALQEDFHLSAYCKSVVQGGDGSGSAVLPTAGDTNFPPNSNRMGFPAFLPFQVISSISLKVNDSTQAVETYDQAHEFGRLCVFRAISTYDHTTLEEMDETLFTPVWNYQKGETSSAFPSHPQKNRQYDTGNPEVSTTDNVGNTAVTMARVKRVSEMTSPRRTEEEAKPTANAPVHFWDSTYINRKILPFPMILAFCTAKAVSNNIRKLDLELTYVNAESDTLMWNNGPLIYGTGVNIHTVTYRPQAALKDVRVIVSHNRLSPSQNMQSVDEKIGENNEKFAFLYATCGEQPYVPNIQVPYMNVSNLAYVLMGVEATGIYSSLRNIERFINPKYFTNNNTVGITSYTVRYGIDQYPSKTLTFSGDMRKALPYYLLQKTLNKENLPNFRLGIDPVLYSEFCFILGAKFVDSTFPHLSPSKEVRIDLQGGYGVFDIDDDVQPENPKLYYALFRYRTTVIAGDGSVVNQD